MTNELLPCPFCGGTQDENGVIDHDERCFVILFMDVCLTGTGTKKEIETAWNTRAQTVFGMTLDEVRQMMKRDAERERTCHDCLGDIEPFECSECHRRNDTTKFPNHCWYCGAKVVE